MCHEVSCDQWRAAGIPWKKLVISAVLVLVSTVTRAADWTMFRADPALSGVAADAQIPDQPRLLWEKQTVDGVASTPAIVGEKVYVGTVQGDLFCLNLADGREIWKYQSLPNAKPNELAPAFMAPIAVAHDLVFAGDQEGGFHAINLQTGQRVWHVEDGGEIVGGPNIYKDRVLFGSHKGQLTAAWIRRREKNCGSTTPEVPSTGPPTVAGQYTFSTNCQAPFLKVVDIETGKEVKDVKIDARLIASAAVLDGFLYFGTEIGAVYALDWQKGELAWTYANPERDQQIDSSPRRHAGSGCHRSR